MLNIIFAPLLSWYIIFQSMVTNIVTASPVIPTQVDSPPNARMQQDARELIERLQLTPEQVDQLEGIQAHYQGQLAALSEAVGQRDRELTALLVSSATPEEIRRKQTEITILKQQLSELLFNQSLEIRAIFTTAQRQQIAELYGAQQFE